MVLDTYGALYFCDVLSNRIRRVRPDGTIETVAGNGYDYLQHSPCIAAEKPLASAGNPCMASLGDGGPSLEATIWWPKRLLFTKEGDLLVVMTNPFATGFWGGGRFSQLRRICSLSQSLPTLIEEEVSPASEPVKYNIPLLLQVYPNPANPLINITFSLEQDVAVTVEIRDILGQKVCLLASRIVYPIGIHRLMWDGRDEARNPVSSGCYLIQLHTGNNTQSRKVTVLW